MTNQCTAEERILPQYSTIIFEAAKTTFSRLMDTHKKRRQVRLDRAAFQQMLTLDDDVLDDIGVTRSDVEWANQLPIQFSAARALQTRKTRARPKKTRMNSL